MTAGLMTMYEQLLVCNTLGWDGGRAGWEGVGVSNDFAQHCQHAKATVVPEM